jgi:hypothetical protein
MHHRRNERALVVRDVSFSKRGRSGLANRADLEKLANHIGTIGLARARKAPYVESCLRSFREAAAAGARNTDGSLTTANRAS